MTLEEIIKGRRSISSYQDKQVPAELMEELLNIAVWVPNHKLTEPWRFVFIQGEAKQKLAEINREIAKAKSKDASEEERELVGRNAYQKIMDIPFIILVINKQHPQEKLREEDYAATSCMIQNFSLLAWEKEISVFWKTGKLAMGEETAKLIGLENDERVVGLLQIGYPEKSKIAYQREKAENRITILQ